MQSQQRLLKRLRWESGWGATVWRVQISLWATDGQGGTNWGHPSPGMH